MNAPDEARRHLVWIALAELYLDTELEEDAFQRIAATCVASGFSWHEIQLINYNEVAPALWFNIQDIAGEWDGWDEEWLVMHIQQSYQPTPRRYFGSVRCWQKQVDSVTRRPMARIAAYLR